MALLDTSEDAHSKCLEFFRNFEGEFVSSEAVLTEATHLFARSIRAQKNCLEFFINGGALLVPQSRESLSQAMILMEKYNDVPMDYADASLVCIAEEAGISEVYTLDFRGFSTYRLKGRRGFTIVPGV